MATSTFQDYYRKTVVPKLVEQFGYKNPMQVPKLLKIVVNSGLNTNREKEVQQEAMKTLAAITGQKPVVTKAKTSISNFKLREGMPVGVCTTMRRERMYDFLYRLINITLPRVRDFRGVSGKAFDGAGNYNMGLSEQNVFNELDLDKIKYTVGMNITIVTSAKSDAEAKSLLALLGMPFNS